MLHIHGGGLFAGQAGPSVNGPEYLMESGDVVVVSIAYRLYAFGFMSTGSDLMPGNFGFKDQALAIKWVAKNIEHFGGNPKRITLFGVSSGGDSCHFHLFSPQTRHLISKVILMSGSALVPYHNIDTNPLSHTRDVAINAGILNAKSLSESQLVEKLRQLSAVKLINASDKTKV
jgi:juvenile-hormone esterase